MNDEQQHSSLGDRLQAAGSRRFVGRAAELAQFRAALTAESLPFNVLYVYGPGGVGKTTLLREFRQLANEFGTPTYYLNAIIMEASPQALVTALAAAMKLPPGADPLDALQQKGDRQVLLIDGYEMILALDRWLRHHFLPRLPANMITVLAGRDAPDPGWERDPDWQALFQVLPLRNLSPAESEAYLAKEQIPADRHQSVLDFTHGHPLALSLVADLYAQRSDVDFSTEATPDVVHKLVERFVEHVPSPAHRSALEACALTRAMTEKLLGDMLALPDAHELFEWLRGLSFIESTPRGLAPHALARDALAAELRWRNPDWYSELHNRARRYYLDRVRGSQGQAQQEKLIDYIFLHRDNAIVRPFFQQLRSRNRDRGAILPERAGEADWPRLVEMVAEHEGEASARLAAYWFERQPQNVILYRDNEGHIQGLLFHLSLHSADEADINSDPATRSAWRYLQSQAPLRETERATYFRFWLAADSYQAISPVQSLIFVHMVRHYLVTPGLAYSFLPSAEPRFWASIFAYADLHLIPEAAFTVGEREYGVFGHDWRVVPPIAWLDLLAQRETAVDPQNISRPPVVEPVLVLSRDAFETAVREALHHYRRPDQLNHSPLLRSRLVRDDQSGETTGDPSQRLQAIIREAAATMEDDPRRRKYYKALYHTYFQPAPTQEEAAEIANVPYGSFRRHLKRGVEALTDLLWEREIGRQE